MLLSVLALIATLYASIAALGTLTLSYEDFNEYGSPQTVRRSVGSWEESRYEYAIDEMGRVEGVDAYADGALYASVSYTFGLDGKVQSVSAGSQTLNYVRNGARMLTQVQSGTGLNLACIVGRDGAGRATDIKTGSGCGAGAARQERVYDALGRVEQLTTTSMTGDVEVRDTAYDWQGRADLVEVAFNSTPTEALDYEYSVEGWLTQESRSVATGSGWTTSVRAHSYDEAGNRLSTAVDSVVEHEWTYDPGNLLATIDGDPVDFNAQGEMEWDPRGYEVMRNPDGSEFEVNDPAASVGYRFLRDPFGDPIGRNDGADDRRQLWGNPQADLPLLQIDESGVLSLNVAVEGVQMGRLSSSAYTPVVADTLGTVVLDGSTFLGVPEAFGAGANVAAVGSTQQHLFAGLESMPDLPFQLSRARLYDPTVGRFTSVDPIGLQGGDHRFMYAENQPTGLVDPGGLSAVWNPHCDGDGGCSGGRGPGLGTDPGEFAMTGSDGSSESGSFGGGGAEPTESLGARLERIAAERRRGWAAAESGGGDAGGGGGSAGGGEGGTGTTDGAAGSEGAGSASTEQGSEGETGTPSEPSPKEKRKGKKERKKEERAGKIAGDHGLTKALDWIFGGADIVFGKPPGEWIDEQAGRDLSTLAFGQSEWIAHWDGTLGEKGTIYLFPYFGKGAFVTALEATGSALGQMFAGMLEAAGQTSRVGNNLGNKVHNGRGSELPGDLADGMVGHVRGADARLNSEMGTLVGALDSDHGIPDLMSNDPYRAYHGATTLVGEGAAAASAASFITLGVRLPSCFPGDTPVLTSDGWTAIEDVRVGDRVWSCDEDTGDDCDWRRVWRVKVTPHQSLLRVMVEQADGSEAAVDVTPGHPFYVDGRGWIAAEWLEVGDRLADAQGGVALVSAVWPAEEDALVYNLTVAVGHTYFVGGDDGLWVHNSYSRWAARREAMRGAGIPTSQQPVGQRSVWSRSGQEAAGRQYDYLVPGEGGKTKVMSVQHSLSDRVEGHGPHWEAGSVKPEGQLDGLGRPRLQSTKVKVNE